jgi:DNA polymerase IV
MPHHENAGGQAMECWSVGVLGKEQTHYSNTPLLQLSLLCQILPVEVDEQPRAIIHLDMDCFYAAIEVRDRPSLRGKPVAVGGARDRRGVLTTCNYEARAFGVHSAMPTFMALQRCPNLIVLPTRFDVYRREAAVIRGILYRFTPVIEPLSLDEAYLDVSEHPGAPGPLAQVIRGTIFRKTKLTSSAGIGPNKLIAKIASEINKPNGQFEVKPEQVSEFMEKLPVRQIWGIGEKTERKLEELGVKTCGQLQRFSRPELVDLFGKFGLDLYDLCRGIDHRPVEPDRPRKSLSTEETFAADLTTLEQCEEKLEELFQDLMADLAQKESTREITKIFVKLKFHDFTRTTAERAGLAPTLEDFRPLLDEAFSRTGKPVRLIGVGVRFAEATLENAQMDLL